MAESNISDTPPQVAAAIIAANRLYQDLDADLEKTRKAFLNTEFTHLWDEVKEFLIPIKDDGGATITDSSVEILQPEPWYSEPLPDENSYWERYVDLLLRKGWKNAINDIRTSTRDLIDRIPNPNAPPLDVYGLVVGRVQSGKTANYTGLISRAVDSGYNLVIVMSGTLNNLRDQTQARLLREFSGHMNHPSGYNVEKPHDKMKQIELLTNIGDDNEFKWPDENFLDSDRPMLAVIKKTVPVLGKVHDWLSSTTEAQRKNLKLLIIDDESDYGSVNTNRKRAKTETLQDEVDEIETDETKEELAASKTNAYVRGILSLFPLRAYLGYTATPYANVMIDPNEDGAEFDFENGRGQVSLGKTLYPKNFIRLLNKIPGYVGLGEIFPPNVSNKHVSIVSKSEAKILRNGKVKKFPNKSRLKEALADFVVSGAIKKGKLDPEKWNKSHHTMMVHVTHSVPQMKPLATLIDSELKKWKFLIYEEFDDEYSDFETLLKDSWERYSDVEFDIEVISDFMTDIQETRLVNSEDDEGVKQNDLIPNLDFEASRVVGVVVGGNLLSRGLTVEGLTISFFVRSAGTYDTAIQMCRWNGIRSELERKLIRVYLTKDMRSDYQWLNLVERDLRDDIKHYHETGLTPSDFAVRILMHQVEGRKRMLPSNRNKMAAVIKCDRGIHKTIQQTRGFHLDNTEIMVRNSELTLNFLGGLNLKHVVIDDKKSGHYIARKVKLESIWNWFDGLKFPLRGLNSEGIMGYFSYMNTEFPENLKKWSVILVGRGSGGPITISDNVSIKMPTRARNSELGIAELATDRHLSLDIKGYPDGLLNNKGQFSRNLMFNKRAEDNPALILYLLDPNYKNTDQSTDFYSQEVTERPDCIVAPTVILPKLELDEEQRKDLIAYYRLETLPGSGR